MSNSEDVKALFRRFGGNASSYQEIVSHDQVGQAEQKWPMLRQINPAHHQEAPSVKRASSADDGVRQSQETISVAPLVAPAAHVGGFEARRGEFAASADRHEALTVSKSPAPHALAVDVPVSRKGSFLSGKGSAPKRQAESTPVEPVMKAEGGLFGRKAAPESPRKARFTDKFFAAPAPAPVIAPALAKGLGRSRFAKGALVAQSEHVSAPAAVAVVAAGAGSGLGRVFSSKLSAASPVERRSASDSSLADAESQGRGLGRMFERMAAPPPPATPAPAKVAAGRKKAIKW